MHSFLVEEKIENQNQLLLTKEESDHATKSLRLRPGDSLRILDGQGGWAEAKLQEIIAGRAHVHLGNRGQKTRKTELFLLQASLKGPKSDWLVEKLTEIGVANILFMTTDHSVGSADKDKIDRWERISKSALKQSGNLFLPKIHPEQSLASLVESLPPGDLRFVLSPTANRGLGPRLQEILKQEVTASKRILLAIGPEGGFSPEELRLLEAKDFMATSLSTQTLRGETAAVVAAGIAAHCIDF